MKFLNKKFCFKKNEHKDVIFLDDNYANIKLDGISFFKINFSEINIYYIIMTLFQKFFFNEKKINFKDLYYKNLFNSFTPKLAVGHDINGRAFYCNKICPKILTLTYQLGILWKHDIEEFKERRYENSKCDYYYVYDKMYKDIFSKFIQSKFIISGSIKNNEIKILNNTKNYNITYISDFRKADRHMEESSRNCQSYILKIIDQFCEQKKINFNIALSSMRPDKRKRISYNEEIKFIKKFAKNFEINNLSSYELAEQSKVIICLNSNLGYELFARKKRVLFLHLHETLGGGDKRQRLYDSKMNSDFMIIENDKSLILKKLEKMMMMSDVEWMRIFNNSSLKIPFDEGNTLLKNNIKNILN